MTEGRTKKTASERAIGKTYEEFTPSWLDHANPADVLLAAERALGEVTP